MRVGWGGGMKAKAQGLLPSTFSLYSGLESGEFGRTSQRVFHVLHHYWNLHLGSSGMPVEKVRFARAANAYAVFLCAVESLL